jgi:uncharacterized protein
LKRIPVRWNRTFSLWLILAVVLATGGFLSLRRHLTARILLNQTKTVLPADGRRHSVLRIHLSGFGGLTANEFHGNRPDLQLLQLDSKSLEGFLQAPVTPGEARLNLFWHRERFVVPVKFVLDSTDSFGDGTPDFLRLHSPEDRQAFRSWFTLLAEIQASHPKDRVPAEINDCAALLRYSYREALHVHDEHWLADHLPEGLSPGPSVRQYQYLLTPLGPSLFRVKPGPFAVDDLENGSFAQFADARSLMELNAHLVSRNLQAAMRGDLIFYRQLEQNSPYHSMVISGDKADWVIYHTGPVGQAKGEMRRVAMEDLLRHPDVRWRPLPENTNFLGVYRWNILREGD